MKRESESIIWYISLMMIHNLDQSATSFVLQYNCVICVGRKLVEDRLICVVFFFISKAKTLPDERIECTLRVRWGEFVGKGANYKIAKATAAKLAMQALERRDTHETGAVTEGRRTGKFQPDAQRITKKIRP